MTKHRRLAALGAFGAIAAVTFVSAPATPSLRPLVIEHVTVVTMAEDGTVLHDMSVAVEQGRIISITPSKNTSSHSTSQRIDGRGKWLMPGLTDMHVHVENDRLLRLFLHSPVPVDGASPMQDTFTPYLANGVLQVFDLSAMSETVGQSIEIESGRVLGPHIALAAMIDGPNPTWPLGMTRSATTPEQGRQAVRDAAAEGYGYIKVYSSLDLATFTAIVDEARKLKLRVVGHIPQRGKGITDSFFQPGFDMVAHAEEFAQQTRQPDESAIPSYVEMAKRNGTWLTATLTLDERLLEETRDPKTLKSRPELQYLPPSFYPIVVEHNPYVAHASAAQIAYLQNIVTFNRKLVMAFSAAGLPVLAGTDSPVPGLVPGFALHDELEALVEAGLDNRHALEGATRLAAEWLGVAADRGVVAVGKRADLLLLDADPLANVANTRRIAGVILGGRYLSRADLDARMKDLKQRNIAARH